MRLPNDPTVPDPDTRALRILIADDDEDVYVLTRDLLLRAFIGGRPIQLDSRTADAQQQIACQDIVVLIIVGDEDSERSSVRVGDCRVVRRPHPGRCSAAALQLRTNTCSKFL